MAETAQPCSVVIFGGSGDLARRKLLPALGRLAAGGQLDPRTRILGVARSTQLDDASYRELVAAALAAAKVPGEVVSRLKPRLSYQPLGAGRDGDFRALAGRLAELERADGGGENRVFYLALPPAGFAPAVTGLTAAGLHRSSGWTRVVVEKPFGRDLATAGELNALLHGGFEERQLFRIDHYLGKDTVQNLLVLRFANAFFESLWNRDRIEAVQITVAEDLGVGDRAGYYDQAGALRDMVQNHLTQLLSLVAMEVPEAMRSDAIHDEKVKLLRSISPIARGDVVLGQYAAGRIDGAAVPGYRDERGVAPGSRCETFVALKLEIDNWRWQGVPFYLRTGKRLGRRLSRIAIQFRRAPVCLFRSLGGCQLGCNILALTLQPDEGFDLRINVKRPGAAPELVQVPLAFRYRELVPELPEAYRLLVLDAIRGDRTLFVRDDEVEVSWRLYQPLLDDPPEAQPYAAGSWGPAAADRLAIAERALVEEG
ncbi:MAG: glucose-6-phosphate dehydrogenase [Deltaproteobacteria bacterium]|nr:glucose-6-phosphate dehydrogenase [Deltaproteobacteria bacterium]